MIHRTVAVAVLLLGLTACGSEVADDPSPDATPAPSVTTGSDFCDAWADVSGRAPAVSGVETPGNPPDQAAIQRYADLVDLTPSDVAADVRTLAGTADLGTPDAIRKFATANARVTAWVEQNC